MGISKGSVWGNIKQSVGSAVGYRLKGQNVVRQKPLSYNDANTLLQQKNRTKQAFLVVLYRQFRNFVQRMYSGMPETYSDYNSFVSLNHQAIEVDDNLNPTFSPDLCVLAKGTAQNVRNISFSIEGVNVKIDWDTSYDSVNGFPGDLVNILCYDSVHNVVKYSNVNTLLRSSGTILIPGVVFTGTTHVLFSVKNVNNIPSDTLAVVQTLF